MLSTALFHNDDQRATAAGSHATALCHVSDIVINMAEVHRCCFHVSRMCYTEKAPANQTFTSYFSYLSFLHFCSQCINKQRVWTSSREFEHLLLKREETQWENSTKNLDERFLTHVMDINMSWFRENLPWIEPMCLTCAAEWMNEKKKGDVEAKWEGAREHQEFSPQTNRKWKQGIGAGGRKSEVLTGCSFCLKLMLKYTTG